MVVVLCDSNHLDPVTRSADPRQRGRGGLGVDQIRVSMGVDGLGVDQMVVVSSGLGDVCGWGGWRGWAWWRWFEGNPDRHGQ